MALESFHHKQLAEILRGKLLHVLAVIVDLPCWRETTWIQHAPTTATQTQERQRAQSEMGEGGLGVGTGENMKLLQNRLKYRSGGRGMGVGGFKTAAEWAVGVGDGVNKVK